MEAAVKGGLLALLAPVPRPALDDLDDDRASACAWASAPSAVPTLCCRRCPSLLVATRGGECGPA